MAKLSSDIEAREAAITATRKSIAELRTGREETAEHTELTQQVVEKEKRVAELDATLSKFAEFDPEHIEKLKSSMPALRDGANRWTDNLFCCQSWVSQKFGIEKADVFKQFEVPEDIDYLE